MKISVLTTGITYDLNFRGARLALRDDIAKFGFFNFEENKPLWPVFEQASAGESEVKAVVYAIMLFDQVLQKERVKQ